MFVMCYLISLR